MPTFDSPKAGKRAPPRGSTEISYSHPGGRVILDTEDTGNEIVFSVKDSGIGIPRDEQKRIFERFYRASNASSMKTDGTGSGLYIAFVLAGKIGARVTFESAEGAGSTFYLHIPKTGPQMTKPSAVLGAHRVGG